MISSTFQFMVVSQSRTMEKKLNKETQKVKFVIEISQPKSNNVSKPNIPREQIDLELRYSEGDLKRLNIYNTNNNR